MYSKPLTSRMDAAPIAKTTKVMRGTPVTGGMGAINFSSFMPQGNATPLPGFSGQGMSPLGGKMPGEFAAQRTMGLNQTKAMATLAGMTNGKATPPAQQHETAGQPLLGLPLNKQDISRIALRAGRTAEDGVVTSPAGTRSRKTRTQDRAERVISNALSLLRQKTGADSAVGNLAARFESGGEGTAAIGYDRHGGTSYGKYQIASRVGTMKQFIGFLKSEAPDIASRLEKAGAANTGGRRGAMPDEWRAIAAEQPDRFEKLQDTFIHASHFTPALRSLAEKTGLDTGNLPKALQEVVFSTAVQHGPTGASHIISRAFAEVGEESLNPARNAPKRLAKAQENLIRRIYDARSGQFESSVPSVQAAVKSRLRQEMGMAIGMLRQENTSAA